MVHPQSSLGDNHPAVMQRPYTERCDYDREKNPNIPYSEFETLPGVFFNNDKVAPPLVCKEWLRQILYLRDEESSTNAESDDEQPLSILVKNKREEVILNALSEDELPLIEIIKQNRSNSLNFSLQNDEPGDESYMSNVGTNTCQEDVPSNFKKVKRKKATNTKNIPVINRPRGRPKKNSAQKSSDILNNIYKYLDITDSKSKDSPNQVSLDHNYDISNSPCSFSETTASELYPYESANNINKSEADSTERNPESFEVRDESFDNDDGEISLSHVPEEHDYVKQRVRRKRKKEGREKEGLPVKKKRKRHRLMVGVLRDGEKMIYPCNDCSKSFSALSTLKNHMRIHNGTLIKCKDCDKGFTTNYLLKCHMRLHTGDLFTCCTCGKGFTTAEMLKVHARGHSGEKPFSCQICGKSFPSASNLAQHKETHDAVKKYLCSECGASFSQKRCLDGHMLSHGEKNHICATCGKLWARKSDLVEHMRVHTGLKPYKCDICCQTFSQTGSLKRHKLTHTENKMVPCFICHKKFKSEHYYKVHCKRNHSDAKKRKLELRRTNIYCLICEEKFKTDVHYRKHWKKAHENISAQSEADFQLLTRHMEQYSLGNTVVVCEYLLNKGP